MAPDLEKLPEELAALVSSWEGRGLDQQQIAMGMVAFGIGLLGLNQEDELLVQHAILKGLEASGYLEREEGN